MTLYLSVLALIYYLVLDRKVLPLLRQPLVQALFLGAVTAQTVLWQLQAQLPGSPPLHFLGVTCVTLLLGLRLSLLTIPLALTLPLAATALYHSWLGTPALLWPDAAFYLRWLALTLVALQSYLSYLLIARYLPAHLFVAIFVSGFLNSLLCGAAFVLWQGLGQFALADAASTTQLSEFLLIMPLLAMPEALLNGMALTLLLVYRPHWVAAFKAD